MRFAHLMWPGIVMGAVAIGVASYVRNAPQTVNGVAAPYGGPAQDPIEQLAFEAERRLLETREVAGRGAGWTE